MQVCVIINSRLRRKRAKKGLEELIHKYPESKVYYTQREKHAIELSKEALERCDLLIVVGGDGSFHEVIQAFGECIDSGKKPPRLALIPAGSANDFARNLKLPKDINEALAWFEEKKKIIDLGRIERESGRHYFLNIADFGLGAEVVKRVNSKSKKSNPHISFLRATTNSFLRYKPYRVKLTWEQGRWEGKLAALAIANGTSFGSGLYVAPNAIIDDGIFQFTRIEDLSIFDYLLNVLKLKKKRQLTHPKIHYYAGAWIEVELLDNRCSLEADGEYIGKGNARISIMKKSLSLVAT